MLDKLSWNGYVSMGFDIYSLIQDKEQDSFTIKTQYPIPLAFYMYRYTWAKYGHRILPSTILLNQIENLQTHSLYHIALQQLLRTDLDGNLSTSLNSLTKAKLDEFLSKTTTLGDTLDKFMKNPESRELFGAKIKEISMSATIIPLSLFIIYFCQEVSKA